MVVTFVVIGVLTRLGPKPVGYVVNRPWSCRYIAAWRARCAPIGAQVTKTERDG